MTIKSDHVTYLKNLRMSHNTCTGTELEFLSSSRARAGKKTSYLLAWDIEPGSFLPLVGGGGARKELEKNGRWHF